jgi:hypothetical protein
MEELRHRIAEIVELGGSPMAVAVCGEDVDSDEIHP